MSRHAFPLQNNCLPARRIVSNFPQWRDAGKHRMCRPSYTLTDGRSPQSVGNHHHNTLRSCATNLYGGTEPQIPIPYPFTVSREAVEHANTTIYSARRPVKTDGATTSDTLPFPCLRRSGGAPTIPKCTATIHSESLTDYKAVRTAHFTASVCLLYWQFSFLLAAL